MADELERYRIVRPLGTGGAAEVFEAVRTGDQAFERRVALKRPLASEDEDPAATRAFIDEARIASALHHANIASVLDFGMSGGRPYLVCELVDGLDLETAVSRAGGPPPLAVSLHVVTELAHALAYAHAAVDSAGRPMRLVHRDVSPENVLLSWQGDVKLSDFGIAHALRREQKTRAGVTKGKLGYMAPEQLAGADVDRRADLFALGCVLHWLIAGRTPMQDDAARAVIVRGEAPPLDASIPADVRALLGKALHGDREARLGDAQSFARASGAALRARLSDDGRSTLQSWMLALQPAPTEPQRLDLFNVPLFASQAAAKPRPETRALEPPPEPTRATELAPTPAEMDAVIGQIVHGFRIEKRLGGGAMARIYLARHLTLERRYAVKLMQKEIADNARAQQRFRREAQELSRVRHPNVVEVADFGATPDGQPFIAMEYLEGRSLGEALEQDGPFAPARVRKIARDLSLGLAALEREGLVHRDLKPRNIMLVAPDERAVIVDFGLVRALDGDEVTRLTRQGDVLGTISYMAPEQIESADRAEPASDRYALGAIIYAMLTGRPPFGRKVAEVIDGHLNRTPPPPPPAEGLGELALALLAKSPSARPSIDAVIALLEGLPEPELPALPSLPRVPAAKTEPVMLTRTTTLDLSAQGSTPSGVRPPTPANLSGRLAVGIGVCALLGAGAYAWSHRTAELAVVSGPDPSPTPTVAVRAAPRAILLPVEEPDAGAAPLPDASVERPRRAAPSEPAPTRDAALEKAKAALQAALQAQGLRSSADLAALGPATATRALEEALRDRDGDAAARLIAGAEAEIGSLLVDRALVDRLVDRTGAALAKIPAEARAALEERQVDLAERATRRDVARDPVKLRGIVRELIDFERELARR